MGQRGRGKREGRRRLPEPLPLVAALIVDNGSGMFMAGCAGSVLLQCPLRLSAGLCCQVWTRMTVFSALVLDSSCGICRAGIAGVALRAVFLFLVVRPKMLRIMAGMAQKDICALFLGSGMCKAWFAGIFPLALCSSCGSCLDALHHGRYGPEGQLRGEILADMVPVVQTADNCGSSAVAALGKVINIPVLVQTPIRMVFTVWQTIEIHQFLLYKVVDSPVDGRGSSTGRRHSLRGPMIRLFSRPRGSFPCCCTHCGRCPTCAGCAGSQVLVVRRQSRSHSSCSLRSRYSQTSRWSSSP